MTKLTLRINIRANDNGTDNLTFKCVLFLFYTQTHRYAVSFLDT